MVCCFAVFLLISTLATLHLSLILQKFSVLGTSVKDEGCEASDAIFFHEQPL